MSHRVKLLLTQENNAFPWKNDTSENIARGVAVVSSFEAGRSCSFQKTPKFSSRFKNNLLGTWTTNQEWFSIWSCDLCTIFKMKTKVRGAINFSVIHQFQWQLVHFCAAAHHFSQHANEEPWTSFFSCWLKPFTTGAPSPPFQWSSTTLNILNKTLSVLTYCLSKDALGVGMVLVKPSDTDQQWTGYWLSGEEFRLIEFALGIVWR